MRCAGWPRAAWAPAGAAAANRSPRNGCRRRRPPGGIHPARPTVAAAPPASTHARSAQPRPVKGGNRRRSGQRPGPLSIAAPKTVLSAAQLSTSLRTVERTRYVTSTVHDPIELLRNTLEEQFQRYTDQLVDLTVRRQQPDRGGYDDDTLTALIASARQAVADTAQALRRMAEGSYGTCERCTGAIPLQRLEILPH